MRHALVIDLSEDGLRLQRPIGGPRVRQLAIELEIPGIDEVMWARGEICFDEVWRTRDPAVPGGMTRTSGVKLVSAASRHLRMLREFVHDSWRVIKPDADFDQTLMDAACYARG